MIHHQNFLFEEMVLDLPGAGESSGSEDESDQEAIDNPGTEASKSVNDDSEYEYDVVCPQISESTANHLYDVAGADEVEISNEMAVVPSPHAFSTWEEQLILKAKGDLGINHELDDFQVQSLVALLNNRNVILISPCGSGKMLVFHMGVYLMRVKTDKPKGVGLCLQPLNNILYEKTNNNPPIKTAYLTMTGEAVQAERATLSHSFDEVYSGDIGCLLGHAESFLSPPGK